MNIKFFEIETPIYFRQGVISVLEIHNKLLFKNLVMNLYKINQGLSTDTSINIIDKDEISSLKNFELITDVFNINESGINNKITKFLNSELENSDLYKPVLESLENLKGNFLRFFDDFPFELCYNDNVTILDLLKDFSPKISFQSQVSYLGIINNYLKAIKLLNITNLIIFVDIKKYLSIDEIKEFYSNIFMIDIPVLIIESTSADLIKDYEWKLIIDDDLYEKSSF